MILEGILNPKAAENTELSILQELYRYKRENTSHMPQSELESRVEGVDDGILRGMQSNDLIHITHVGPEKSDKLQLKQEGQEALRNGNLRVSLAKTTEAINGLMDHERRSSAIETVFTWALLTSAVVQIIGLIWNWNTTRGIVTIGAISVAVLGYLVVMLVSWWLGGENVRQVLRSKI